MRLALPSDGIWPCRRTGEGGFNAPPQAISNSGETAFAIQSSSHRPHDRPRQGARPRKLFIICTDAISNGLTISLSNSSAGIAPPAEAWAIDREAAAYWIPPLWWGMTTEDEGPVDHCFAQPARAALRGLISLFKQPRDNQFPSLRAQRSNPSCRELESWIASSLRSSQ